MNKVNNIFIHKTNKFQCIISVLVYKFTYKNKFRIHMIIVFEGKLIHINNINLYFIDKKCF
jgi:hypothetical protein